MFISLSTFPALGSRLGHVPFLFDDPRRIGNSPLRGAANENMGQRRPRGGFIPGNGVRYIRFFSHVTRRIHERLFAAPFRGGGREIIAPPPAIDEDLSSGRGSLRQKISRSVDNLGRGFLIKFASDRLGENIKLRIKFLLTQPEPREVFH